jgi:hypothetical protein
MEVPARPAAEGDQAEKAQAAAAPGGFSEMLRAVTKK